MRAELRRLVALQAEAQGKAPEIVGHFGEQLGDLFRAMSDEERRAYLRGWIITVHPEAAEDGRRWSIADRHALDPAEVEARQRAMLKALRA